MTIDDAIINGKDVVSHYKKLCEEEFISDYYCPGGFRKPSDDEIKRWNKVVKENEKLVEWLEELKFLRNTKDTMLGDNYG